MRTRLAVLLTLSLIVAGACVPAIASILPVCATTVNNGIVATLVPDNSSACVVNYPTLTGDIVVMENFSNITDPSTWSDLMHFAPVPIRSPFIPTVRPWRGCWPAGSTSSV